LNEDEPVANLMNSFFYNYKQKKKTLILIKKSLENAYIREDEEDLQDNFSKQSGRSNPV